MSQFIDVPEVQIPRVVIIGGGFGGIQLAKKLAKKEVQVVLLDRNNYHTFQPLLYQVATAGLEADSIAFPIRKIFIGQKNFYFRLANVEKISPEEKKVYTNIGSIAYDYLVVATGSKTNYFGLEQIRQHSMAMKTVIQALDLRSYMLQNFEKALDTDDLEERDARMSFVIVGGGPTGVELAGALAELKNHVLAKDYPELDVRRMQIHLVEAADTVLNNLDPKSSQKTIDFLKKLGVNIWLKTQVTGYEGITVFTNTGKNLIAKNLIWTAGVQGNIPSGFKPDMIIKGNRLIVDEFNQVKGLEKVFAIGDCACMISEKYPKGHPMVAPVAIQQGKLLAENILKELANKPKKPFIYKDKGSMATVGKNKAVVEIGKYKSQGAFAWFIWMFVHVISLIGTRNKFVVISNWLWNYVNYDRSNRIIIRPFNKSKVVKEEAEVEVEV
ncbi:MAG: NAD(P)/FAD-dependent oxidoreductase [Flammeovirgaceae bacterium]